MNKDVRTTYITFLQSKKAIKLLCNQYLYQQTRTCIILATKKRTCYKKNMQGTLVVIINNNKVLQYFSLIFHKNTYAHYATDIVLDCLDIENKTDSGNGSVCATYDCALEVESSGINFDNESNANYLH